jgi:hypothetical protein
MLFSNYFIKKNMTELINTKVLPLVFEEAMVRGVTQKESVIHLGRHREPSL